MNDKASIKSQRKAAQSQAQVPAADSGRRAPYVAPAVIPLSLIDTAASKIPSAIEFSISYGPS